MFFFQWWLASRDKDSKFQGCSQTRDTQHYLEMVNDPFKLLPSFLNGPWMFSDDDEPILETMKKNNC